MRQLRFVVIAVAVAGIAVGLVARTSRASSGEPAVSREQWEYLVVQGGTTNLTSSESSSLRKESSGSFSRESFPLEGNLDKLGAKGWELVAVSGSSADPVYYFKRQKG